MVRRNAEDKAAGDQGEGVGRVQADRGSVAIGGINIGRDLSGSFTIGYTAEQVSLLLAQITTKFQPKPFSGECPYKGLEVFEEEDADLFFGREWLVEDLIGRVKESRTIFITGPSGSGKSSLVRAGLIHALKDGAINALRSNRWLYETMKPGREPLKDLALAFSRLKGPDLADYFQAHANETDILHRCAESVLSGRKDQRFVLFVDQFEEVFTQVNQEAERVAFLNMLAHAGTVENGRVIVLFAMRSDFVSNCAAYPAINELLSGQFRQIGAMQPEELVSAIALPAKKVGLPVEAELIAQIINDMKGEPGALPLMQFALKELFEARQAKGGDIALTLEDYLERGGIQKMLARHADATLSQLSANQQELARSIFSGLIEIGRGRQDTRRIALFEELVPANTKTEDVDAVVQNLANARLVITDEQAGKDTVTIAHERLITAWPWLEKLINENRDVIALQNEIANDAKEWEDHKHDASYLYTGARLANAREKLEANKIVLSGLAQAFIEAGIKAHTDELEAIRQRASELRRRSVILTVALVAALIAVGVAGFFWAQSRQQTIASQARELGTQAVLQRDNNFLLSLLLGVEAFYKMDLPATRNVLLGTAASNPQLVQYLSGHHNPVTSVAFNPDGNILASGAADDSVILWDAKTWKQIGQLKGHSQDVNEVAFSPDGNILASGSDDNTIILWDVKTQKQISQPLKGQYAVNSIAFSPDGNILASGHNDSTIILWDVKTQKEIGQPLEGPNGLNSIAFNPDGSLLASGGGDNNIILWNVKTRKQIGQTLRVSGGSVLSVRFSPDGSLLASGTADNSVILWDVKTEKQIGELRGHDYWVWSLAFSPDGNILASGSEDSTIILWDVKTGHQSAQLRGHSNTVWGLAFSPDGNILASGSEDSTIILWDVKAQQQIGQPLGEHSEGVNSVAFSPDGNLLAAGNDQNNVVLWDVKTRKQIGQLEGHNYPVVSVAFSPDGSLLASGTGEIVILWDVKTQKQVSQPFKGSSVAFSPDGRTLTSNDGVLWDIKTQKQIGEIPQGSGGSISSIAFSPDGNMLASGVADDSIILWDAKTWKQIGRLEGHSGTINSVAFSPDGSLLASGSDDRTIILWDVKTQQPIGQLHGHNDWVYSVAFSPDGNMLASGSEDNTIILWDVKTQQPIVQLLKGENGSVNSIAFSPDGSLLASGSWFSNIILWDVTPQSWVEKSCQRAGRNFTRAEWTQYFPNEEYRKTCEQWPLEREGTPAVSPTP